MTNRISVLILISLFMLNSCAKTTETTPQTPKRDWAIAIHGGAGVIDKGLPDSVRISYENALDAVLKRGQELVESGADAMDVVVEVVTLLENDPHFNAGKGAVFNAKGEHELDASIMDGSTLGIGAVASVRTVKNPIKLARLVMEKTPHVLLAGEGAEEFANETDVERVENAWFDTDHRKKAWEKIHLEEQEKGKVPVKEEYKKGTVGCVVLDKKGNLAAGTSTGGMTYKKFGRVGDAPIIGAGTYANNASCAVSCTGTGEEFIRHGVARDISSRMLYKNISLTQAATEVVMGVLKPEDGGIISVSKTGEIAMIFNSTGMFRGAAASDGLFEVKIWE